jgi:hypothetical protein
LIAPVVGPSLEFAQGRLEAPLLPVVLGGGFFALAPLAVDPEIGSHTKHPRARIFNLLKETPERDEAARESILNQILGVPGVAGQRAAIPI